MQRLTFIILCLLTFLVGFVHAQELPSWNETTVKQAILDYVAAVTTPGSADFVPQPERLAVFDNDGTFICERPDYPSSLFQAGLVRSFIADGTIDGTKMPFKAWNTFDKDALKKYGWKEAYQEMNAAFGGMPVTAYRDSARAFMDRYRHPRYRVPLARLYYAPMRELAALLNEHGFQLWVVTGSEQDFMRSFLEDATGVPPEHVIGSWTPAVSTQEGKEIRMVRGTVQVYNGHQAKPGNIETRIGRRPIFVVGNSDNDQPMCRYAVTGMRLGLALWVHHDDSEREYKYDRGTSDMADLVKEKDNAWRISIAKDWKRVFQNGVLDVKSE